MITKPMLAVAAEDLTALKFPVLATPKLDGIRCVVVGGKALSRSFKPIPNDWIRTEIERTCPDGFDGEIMIKGADFNAAQSQVMSRDGKPDFEYHVFDYVTNLNEPYNKRMLALAERVHGPYVVGVFPLYIADLGALLEFEHDCVRRGYEGVMLRSTHSPYKCGRSTLKEGYLLKVKRFADAEATVIGFEELMTNTNEKETDELGHSKRSGKKAGLVPAGTMGTLLVRDIATGVEFGIGSGFDAAIRKILWNNQEATLGKIVTYKHQPSGQKDKPRFPIFKGFRDSRDMS